jgi:hypothetical protein
MWIEQNNEEMQHTMNEAEAHWKITIYYKRVQIKESKWMPGANVSKPRTFKSHKRPGRHSQRSDLITNAHTGNLKQDGRRLGRLPLCRRIILSIQFKRFSYDKSLSGSVLFSTRGGLSCGIWQRNGRGKAPKRTFRKRSGVQQAWTRTALSNILRKICHSSL